MQKSYWENFDESCVYELIIAGAGFAGAWCALEFLLQKPGARVLILERGARPIGASTRNAGFSCIGSPSEMLADIETLGLDKALSMAESRYRGIQKIQKTIEPSTFDYTSCGGYELLKHDQPVLNEIEDKLDWLNEQLHQKLGEENVFSWCTDEMNSQGISGIDAMVKNRLDGAVHSGKLLAALHNKIQDLGASILFSTEVSGWEEESQYVEVFNQNNNKYQANQLLLCTNAFTNSLLPEPIVIPARGQVLVTKPIPGLKLNGTFHFDEGFYYFRNIDDRVLIGGARNQDFEAEKTTAMETTELIQNALEAFLKKFVLKEIGFEVEYRWAGVMAFTHSKMPEIIEISPKVVAVVACNGMGVALLPAVSETIVERILN